MDQDQIGEVEGNSYQTSILYWVGVLEQVANIQFALEIGGPKSIVGRWRTLSVLAEKDGLPITQLANIAFIERTALSRLLDSMEDEGLLRRHPRIEDRRTIEVYITPKGRKMFLKMLPVRRAILKRATRDLSEDDLAELLKKVRLLVRNLSDDPHLSVNSRVE